MKTTVVLILLAAAASPTLAAPYNNHVDIGVLGFFIGNYGAHYERNLNDYFSVRAGGSFMPAFASIYHPDNEESIASWVVFQTTVGGAFWPLGGFRRLFVMAEMGTDFHSVKSESGDTGSAVALRPGALIGWRWVIADRATLTLGGGSDYISVHAKAGDEEGVWTGIWPRAEFGLGYLF